MDFQVLIVGGGAHGVGLMHDLASRRVKGVHLVESALLSSGTSSKSTKLVHGGLRYLERIHQWGLVTEALQERGILLRVLKGLVTPMAFVLPSFHGGRPAWMLRCGLGLYDLLAGDGGLPKSRPICRDEVFQLAPYLDPDKYTAKDAFLYYDAQMSDDAIVRVAAYASVKLGASFVENSSVARVRQRADNGFEVVIRDDFGHEDTVTARYVVNAAGPWCNANLLQWGISPRYGTLLNVGSHLVFAKESVAAAASQCAATLLQNDDGRIVFFIPWQNRWLLGTTESALGRQEPSRLQAPQTDVDYLMDIANKYLKLKTPPGQFDEKFCGVRTMPLGRIRSRDLLPEWIDAPFMSPYYSDASDAKLSKLSKLSRESIIDETVTGLFTIYGGKYTTYRSQSAKLGTVICNRLQCGGVSATASAQNWFLESLFQEHPDIFNSSSELRKM